MLMNGKIQALEAYVREFGITESHKQPKESAG